MEVNSDVKNISAREKSISFFLIPKQEVVFINNSATMRQAIEKMEHHGYSAIPVIDEKGRYVKTLTEGDFLRRIKNRTGVIVEDMNSIKVADIECRNKNKPVSISSSMGDMLEIALMQNFAPVVDDEKIFIGIVRRREIIEFFVNRIEE
jgi:CBS domain-containing protein